ESRRPGKGWPWDGRELARGACRVAGRSWQATTTLRLAVALEKGRWHPTIWKSVERLTNRASASAFTDFKSRRRKKCSARDAKETRTLYSTAPHSRAETHCETSSVSERMRL